MIEEKTKEMSLIILLLKTNKKSCARTINFMLPLTSLNPRVGHSGSDCAFQRRITHRVLALRAYGVPLEIVT